MAEEIKNTAIEAKAGQDGDKRPARGHSPRRFNRNNARPRREEKLFEERVIKISRVSKTVKGGKRMRFTALVVIGDAKGQFGYGLGKSSEVPDAIKKALAAAKKNLFRVQIAKGDTVTHSAMGHFGATQVFLKPAPAGTGLVAGGAVRAILELAGVKNVYSKIYGSRTQTNVVKATVDALNQMKSYESVSLTRYGKPVTSQAKED